MDLQQDVMYRSQTSFKLVGQAYPFIQMAGLLQFNIPRLALREPLRNVGLSPNYTALTQKSLLFIATPLRTSNPTEDLVPVGLPLI
jgi:hypothetical protein